MGLRLNTNVTALIGQKGLLANRQIFDRTYERLTSGSKINRASDDPAGLAVSEPLRAQLRSNLQIDKNAHNGISAVRIAEGALSEISTALLRMRELSVQAASDILNKEDRRTINLEYQQLLTAINQLSANTEFSSVFLLNGSAKDLHIQIGIHNDDDIDRIKLSDLDGTSLNTQTLGIDQSNVLNKENSQTNLDTLEFALTKVSNLRSQLGTIENRLTATIASSAASRENLSYAISRIRDMDMAEETTELTKQQILMQSGISILGQANTLTKTAFNLLSQQS